MDARQFLRLAEALSQDVSGRTLLTPALDAAACRSVISRAYYAAFHVAHEFLDQGRGRPELAGPRDRAARHPLAPAGRGRPTTFFPLLVVNPPSGRR